MKVKIVNKGEFPLPKYETTGSSGVDIYANIDDSMVIAPMERVLIPTGIYISMPKNCEAQIRARSGLALKYGITMANGIGTIDSDYRGEIKVILINLGEKAFKIKKGDRIAQMVFIRYEQVDFEEVDNLDSTKRAQGGFGHTGI
ncbi:dUTP diphosphatase [Clostridiisalibacter paucivorans]|uniref:dUTP diphosphatase n=1 Tax=Clostridiisalibacter paucivorans TaxID=408753 RepID=UPI0004796318|nr:dUTP diphosphatase [Clostridiisalibacter paucivorans]